jgi:hypothetical protein
LSQIKTGGKAWTASGYVAGGGTGYSPSRGGTGEVGTINPGLNTPVTPGPQPAQIRFYVGADGFLYGLDNVTGQSFKVVAAGGAVQPANYTPTRSV